MAVEITIPRLGWSMDEGTFGEWLKTDGDYVEPGDPIFTMESEKALQEIESVDGGILKIVVGAPQEGDVVTVGLVVAYLVEDGEEIPQPDVSSSASEDSLSSAPSDGMPPSASPAVRRLAREIGVDLQEVRSTGRISENDVRRTAESRTTAVRPGVLNLNVTSPTSPLLNSDHIPDRNSQPGLPAISPRAARLAKRHGIDWTQLTGSGRTGRIRERDVQAAAVTHQSAIQQQHFSGTNIPAKRRLIAQRMMTSVQNTAPVTLTSRVDATQMVSLRAQYKAAGHQPVPAYHDIVARLVALTLSDHPVINSVRTEDGLVQSEDIHIGLAVDTDAGLLVPVVRHVDRLSLLDVARESAELIENARQRKCTPEQLSGGTFTITNLGQFEIDFFTPIINTPQTAILGLGAIRREAVVVDDDRIEPRHRISLSLTFDHRMTDGAPAARFLQQLCRRIENPGPCLIR
jgi:pyruvate dehydrogenase E2 component (dihydrolipoamide acetyltransferase)